MDFFITSLKLNLKKIMHKNMAWVLALPISLVFLGNFSGTVIEITVGVSVDSPFAQKIFAELSEQLPPMFTPLAFDTEGDLREGIFRGQVNFGYVFKPYLSYAATLEEVTDGILVFNSPVALGESIVSELIFAIILEEIMPNITLLTLYTYFEENNIRYFIEEQLYFYAEADVFMTPAFIGTEGTSPSEVIENISEITAARFSNGLTGLVLLTLALFFIPKFIDEKNTGLNLSLKHHGIYKTYYISVFAALFLILYAIGLVSLAASSFVNNVLSSIFFLLVYTAFICVISLAGIIFLKTPALIQSFGLFLILAHIFFGGMLLDLSEFNFYLGIIQRFFPLFWYIEMMLNSPAY